jgi:hypothetical protein
MACVRKLCGECEEAIHNEAYSLLLRTYGKFLIALANSITDKGAEPSALLLSVT